MKFEKKKLYIISPKANKNPPQIVKSVLVVQAYKVKPKNMAKVRLAAKSTMAGF